MSGRKASYSASPRSKFRRKRTNSEGNDGLPSTSKRPPEARSKSVGDLEYLLSKVTWEFEEVVDRDKQVTSNMSMGQEQVTIQQKERWKRTRENLFEAARNVLHSSLPIGRDTLEIGATAVGYSPVAVLAPPLRVLLYIWDALLTVQNNQGWCLSLTERCVDILVIVENEILEAGVDVALDLKVPLTALTKAFESVRDLLLKEAKRSFIKRYLRRRDTLADLGDCDKNLIYALNLFGLKIQIRCLRQLQETEKLMNKSERDRVDKDKADKRILNKGFYSILARLRPGSGSMYDLSGSAFSMSKFSLKDNMSIDNSARKNVSKDNLEGNDSSRDESSVYDVSRENSSRYNTSADNLSTREPTPVPSAGSAKTGTPDRRAKASSSSDSVNTYATAPSSPELEDYFTSNASTQNMSLVRQRVASLISSRSLMDLRANRENDLSAYQRMRNLLQRAVNEATDDEMVDIIARLTVDPEELPVVVEQLSNALDEQGWETDEEGTEDASEQEQEGEDEDGKDEDGKDEDGKDEDGKEGRRREGRAGQGKQIKQGEHGQVEDGDEYERAHELPESDYESVPESAGSVESFHSAHGSSEGKEDESEDSDSSDDEFHDFEPPASDPEDFPAPGRFNGARWPPSTVEEDLNNLDGIRRRLQRSYSDSAT